MTTSTVQERPATTRAICDQSVIHEISKGAARLRISWLVRRDLTVTKVKSSFLAAAEMIPTDVSDDRLADVLKDLHAISEGDIDPRGGSFKKQAIRASAKLHNLLDDLTSQNEGSSK